MLTEEKIKQVRKQLRSGVPQGEIKNELLNKGYTDEEIEKLFLNSSSKGSAAKESGSRQTYQMHILSLIGASLLITGIAVMSTQTWLKEYGTVIIVLGVIGLVAGYFFSNGKEQNKSSS